MPSFDQKVLKYFFFEYEYSTTSNNKWFNKYLTKYCGYFLSNKTSKSNIEPTNRRLSIKDPNMLQFYI